MTVYVCMVFFKVLQFSTVEVDIAIPDLILQIMLVVSQESPVHRGDVISMLSPMLVASGKIPSLFAEAACTQHALVSTGIKGREVVAAVPIAVEEVLTKSRSRVKGPAVLK